GKTVVVTTSNGTPLIRLGIRRSRLLLVGGLVNNEACASMAGELAAGWRADVKILIPRTPYGECIEDLYAAGLMVRHLSNMGFTPRWDAARIALLLSEAPKQRMLEEMRNSQSAIRVRELGYRDDVEYSLQLDVTSTVPVARGSWIAL
ncbi:MAG: 2-phosphosulfolactate phosphatase, partial [Candidatus Bathyarchaeia archaeon]